MFVKQGGLFIHIHPCSLHLIQSLDRSIAEGEKSYVKTSKGCVIDHDHNTVIDSNDDDDLIDEESDDEADNSNKEGNSESLEDMQDNFEAKNPQREEPENPEHTLDNDENPDNSLEEERNPTISRNELPPRKSIMSIK